MPVRSRGRLTSLDSAKGSKRPRLLIPDVAYVWLSGLPVALSRPAWPGTSDDREARQACGYCQTPAAPVVASIFVENSF